MNTALLPLRGGYSENERPARTLLSAQLLSGR